MSIRTEDLSYRDGSVACSGFLAYDDAQAGKRPGVLVVHEATGLGEHVMERCRMLARAGYVALAADLFGGRWKPKGIDDVMPVLHGFMDDPPTLRGRAEAARAALAALPRVDATRLFAIGYCFGGTTVLELARAGSALLGVVSFHGTLESKAPAGPGAVKASVLVCHGADDPMAPAAQRGAFEAEMRKAGADWTLIAYGNTVHSFTNRAADAMNMEGVRFNALSDARSWRAMQDFFAERLAAG